MFIYFPAINSDESAIKVTLRRYFDILARRTVNIFTSATVSRVLLRFDSQRVLSEVAGFRKLVTVLLVVSKRFLSDSQRTLNGVSP